MVDVPEIGAPCPRPRRDSGGGTSSYGGDTYRAHHRLSSSGDKHCARGLEKGRSTAYNAAPKEAEFNLGQRRAVP